MNLPRKLCSSALAAALVLPTGASPAAAAVVERTLAGGTLSTFLFSAVAAAPSPLSAAPSALSAAPSPIEAAPAAAPVLFAAAVDAPTAALPAAPVPGEETASRASSSARADLASAASLPAPAAAGAPSASERLFDGAGFTAGELADLRDAAENGHEIAVLARADGRRVVLMGEQHHKKTEAAAAAGRFKRNFPYRGIEGYDPSASIGGRLVVAVVLPFVRAANVLASFGAVRSRSAITDAAVEGIVDSLGPDERLALRERIGAMKETELDRTHFAGAVSFRQVARMLDETQEAGSTRRLTLQLEEGHRPDLPEQILSVALPAVFLGAAAAAVLSLLPSSPAVEVLKYAAYSVIGALGWNAIIGDHLPRRFENERWYRAAFPFGRYPYMNGFVRARNETMASNIDRALAENPEIDRLLVLAGKLHLPGLQELLTSRYGFSPVPLPRAPD